MRCNIKHQLKNKLKVVCILRLVISAWSSVVCQCFEYRTYCVNFLWLWQETLLTLNKTDLRIKITEQWVTNITDGDTLCIKAWFVLLRSMLFLCCVIAHSLAGQPDWVGACIVEGADHQYPWGDLVGRGPVHLLSLHHACQDLQGLPHRAGWVIVIVAPPLHYNAPRV